MIRSTTFLYTFLALSLAGAQTIDELKTGKELHEKNKDKEAIDHLQRAIAQKPGDPEVFFYLAASFLGDKQYKNAVDTYKAYGAMSKDPWAGSFTGRATAHRDLGELDECVKALEGYFSRNFVNRPDMAWFTGYARDLDRYCRESPKVRAKASTSKDPINLGSTVNSASSDYMPSANPTGRVLYFTSTRPGGFARDASNMEDLYTIELLSSGWSTPARLPKPINSDRNEGAPAVFSDGQTLLYVACNRSDGKGDCDLYTTHLDGVTWATPRNLGNRVNTEKWDSQPTISSDNKTLIFSSSRPGGLGDEDLYMSVKDRYGEWSTPTNLGPTINTTLDESSPYLASDGRTLYFASEGHPGFGGTDLFKSVFEDGRWSEPVNLGRPINSPADNRYFTIGGAGEIGYFASERPGGYGGLDIYQVEIPEPMRPTPTVVVSGVVTNIKNHKPLDARVLVEDLKTGTLVASARSNSETGKYLVVLPSGRSYSVSASRESFFFYSNRFDVPSDSRYQEVTRDIALTPIEKGSRVVLNNVFFETGKATLSPESRLELTKAIDLLRQNPRMVVEVGGHTDNVGKADANMKLSHDRARSVFDYLVKGGVPSERLKSKGYGQNNPVAANENADGRHKNRRTEFVILDN